MQPPATRRWTPTRADGRDYDPFEHADALGIQVLFRPIRTANELWLPEHDTSVIKEGMREVHRRIAAAHGVAHAVLGHVDDQPKHEALADKYAAERLINPVHIRNLIRVESDAHTIAAELGVTSRLLRVYLNAHPA